MGIRFCARGVPLFKDEGIALDEGWTNVDVDDPVARKAVIAFAGRFAMVHPDDRQLLAAHGLELVGNDLRELVVPAPAVTPDPPLAPDSTTTTATDDTTATKPKKK
jgi:hypothetical protein